MTAGRQVATQSTAPMMVLRPRATRTALQPAAPEMAIQPRNPPEIAVQPRILPEMAIQPRTTSALLMAIQPRTTSAPEMVIQPKAVETDSGPEDMQSSGTEFLLNTPLQRTLSEFVRRTHMPLPDLVGLVRGQTETDYRPNKHMVSAVITQVNKDHHHLEKLQAIAAEGVRVELKKDVPLQAHPPDNHGSAIERVNILRKNVRKEQDAWRCLVLDLDLLAMWPEVFISPFGIVDKAGGDLLPSGRPIHDLSFPEGASINEVTDHDAIPKADYRHCDAVASVIFTNQAGTPWQRDQGYGRRWMGSPGEYEVIGGAISFVHGSHGNRDNPTVFATIAWLTTTSTSPSMSGPTVKTWNARYATL
ncbi:unnamed protein product [Phytophthora fragariaefolia]|uniref:Unnamed protein product n=1 Tax=Phytophthora fragariaefolia TaxID=1490495 RepID=A0A9W6TP90_9STRA|nr:unnamed protein product [Phytophthora fragariaefolia]